MVKKFKHPTPDKVEPKPEKSGYPVQNAPKTAYITAIISFMGRLGLRDSNTLNPDVKDNTGNILGEAFMWDTVLKVAKGHSDRIWKKMEATIIKADGLAEGAHILASSPRFVCSAVVTAPVRRFNAEALADAMSQPPYKVPKHITLKMVEDAKIGTKGNVRLEVVEK